ncbi:MAG: hypothetical protein CR982_06530 [Candidatus Cloacimonadota bacterium]|nr:MAG: hypothetical protein CR982_06530 [Candidatus Cloacimonadota bacterium]PIE79945.1 MAG: hypothetical protein CSA15_02450 [Candidatus Delongbacteria bacterium]
MKIKDLKTAVNFAIEQEQNAADIYNSLLERSSNSGNRKLFEELRNTEYDHKKKLQELDLDNVESFNEDDNIPNIKATDYLVEPDRNGDLDYEDILVLAAKREQKSYEMYKKFSEIFKDNDKLKQLFEILANEEKSHKYEIEKMYDDIVLNEN